MTVTGNFVARLGRFAVLKRRQRQNAFRLVPDVEENRIAGHGDHGAFQLPAAVFDFVRMALLKLRKQIAE